MHDLSSVPELPLATLGGLRYNTWKGRWIFMVNRKETPAGSIALGGMLAAIAAVIMSLGGMIPVATYVCPVISMLILTLVLRLCGTRIAWAWYGAVSLLGLMLCPDKEAAAVFLALGFYPILKPRLDQMRFRVLWKLLLFNGDILLLYWILMHLIGMGNLQQEFAEMGYLMTGVTLALGNVTFFLLDYVLGKNFRRRKK